MLEKIIHKLILVIIILVLNISCQKSSNESDENIIVLTPAQKIEYIKKGNSIVDKSTASISKQLKEAIKNGGIEKAISYCNVKAIPIIDSLSRTHKALIKRTTIKVRNPLDSPDSLEKSILNSYLSELQNNEELTTKILMDDQFVLYTAPIITKPICLNCHGTPGKEINDIDYKTILSFYPEDKAVNYKVGELRGIWSIRFLE